jgi:hypothetical protein
MFRIDDVTLCFIAGVMVLLVAGVLLDTFRRLVAKAWARKVSVCQDGDLKLVVWNKRLGKSETITAKVWVKGNAATIRAVRMWGIVRKKTIIEISIPSKNETLYRTY